MHNTDKLNTNQYHFLQSTLYSPPIIITNYSNQHKSFGS